MEISGGRMRRGRTQYNKKKMTYKKICKNQSKENKAR